MKQVFDTWVSPGVRLPTLHLIVKSWSVCIAGGQERGSIPEVAAECYEALVCPQRNLALNKISLCITQPLQNQVPHSRLSRVDKR